MSEGTAGLRPWLATDPSRLVGRGHAAGDFLEAYDWKVLEEREGFIKVEAHVPDRVRNPRGQLFGGFTPTYVDFISLFAVRAGPRRLEAMRAGARPSESQLNWLATTNMRVDYFDPVVGPAFWLESRIVRERGRTIMVETRFLDPADGTLLVFALTTLRRVTFAGKLGDA